MLSRMRQYENTGQILAIREYTGRKSTKIQDFMTCWFRSLSVYTDMIISDIRMKCLSKAVRA